MSAEKLDIIDLVITALKEHEKRFDALCHRFEKLLDKLEKSEEVNA